MMQNYSNKADGTKRQIIFLEMVFDGEMNFQLFVKFLQVPMADNNFLKSFCFMKKHSPKANH